MALTQVNSAGIADGAIVNADVNNSAAVALSKLSTSGTASSSTFLRGDGAWTAIDLTALSASNLTSGTVPDARFPATLPALSGTALTNLNASNISSGTLAAARLPASYAVLSGSTDNQIATVTGANALQGEASLTFDAGLLKIDDLSGTAGKGRLEFGNSGEQYIEGFDTGNGGSGSYLSFGDGSAEYLRLDSSGRLRIGNTTQNQYTAADDLIVGSGSGDRGLTLYSGSSDSGVIAFSDGTIDTQYRSGQIIYDHSADSMVFRTNGNYTRLKITSDGKIGINETSPDFALHVKTTTDVEQLKVENSASSGRAQIRYVNPHGDWSTGTIGGTTEGDFITYTAEARNYRLYTSNNERLRINSSGLLLLGTTDSGFSTGYTNMTIGNTSTQNTGLTIASSSSNGYSRLHFADGTSGAARYAGWIVYDHSVDAIKFSTANSGSQKVSIDSSGRVLIGVSASYANASIDELQVGNNNSSNQAGITIGSTDECAIAFSDAGDARAGSITYNHGQDAMIFKTVGQNERLRIASDGNIEASGNLKTNNLSGRNRITNGDMRVSQRYGTTETTINVNAWHYILDRFKMYQNTDGQATVTQVTSGYAASNTGSGNALRIKVTSADTSLSGTQQLQLTQVIEGFNCEDLRFGTANAKSFTVSFSILATGASAGNVTGTYCVNATNFGNYDRAYVKEYTIDAIDVWKKVTLTFPGCTDGTWGTGNTGGIRLGWFFAGPTSQQGAANQWHTSYKGSTTNQKNGMGVVNNFYFIKDIQVEEGTIATSFEHRSYGEELARCQRYYEEAMISGQSYIGGANHVGIPAKYAVTKRAAATVSWTLDASGNMNGTSPNAIHRNRIDGAYAYQSAAGNGNYYYYYIYKADAEL